MAVFTFDGEEALLDGVRVGYVKNDGRGDYVETPPRAEWTGEQRIVLDAFAQQSFNALKVPWPEID